MSKEQNYRNSQKEVSFSALVSPLHSALPRQTRAFRNNRTLSGPLTDQDQVLQTTSVGSPAGQSDMDAAMQRMALKSANDLISKYYLCPISPTNAQAFASADPENLTIRVA